MSQSRADPLESNSISRISYLVDSFHIELEHQVYQNDFRFEYHPELQIFSQDSFKFYPESHFEMLSCWKQFPLQNRFGMNQFLLLKVGQVGTYDIESVDLNLILSAGISAVQNMNVCLPIFIQPFQAKSIVKGYQNYFTITTNHISKPIKDEKGSLTSRSSVHHIIERIETLFQIPYSIQACRYSIATNFSFYVYRAEHTKGLFISRGDWFDGLILQASITNATSIADKLHFFQFQDYIEKASELSLIVIENGEYKAKQFNKGAKPVIRLLNEEIKIEEQQDQFYFIEQRVVQHIFSQSLNIEDNRFTSLILEFMETLGLEPCFQSLTYRIAEALIKTHQDFEIQNLEFHYIWKQIVAQIKLIWEQKDQGLNIIPDILNNESIDAFINTIALSIHHAQILSNPEYRRNYVEEQKFKISELVSKCEERERMEAYPESDNESFYDAMSHIEEESKDLGKPKQKRKPGYFRILSPINLMNYEQMQGLLKIKKNLQNQPQTLEHYLCKNLKLLWLYFEAIVAESGSYRKKKVRSLFQSWFSIECDHNDIFNLVYGDIPAATIKTLWEQKSILSEQQLILNLEKDVLFAVDNLEFMDVKKIKQKVEKCIVIDTILRIYENSKIQQPQNQLFYELLTEKFLKFQKTVELNSDSFEKELENLTRYFSAILSIFYKFPSLQSQQIIDSLITNLTVTLSNDLNERAAIFSVFRMFCPNPFKYEVEVVQCQLLTRWIKEDERSRIATANRAYVQVVGKSGRMDVSVSESSI